MLTTHYMDEAERLCDRLAIIDHGQIIAAGTPAELIERLTGHHVVEFAVSGTSDIDGEISAVCRECSASAPKMDYFLFKSTSRTKPSPSCSQPCPEKQGSKLVHLTTRQASLEDVFVKLTGRHLREN